ncbi:MAG: class I SAM-dependent methyltransferase [Anaerolineae bacterium]|nr:class I SAM-dependent methyltransferase [Anaerolineae bacterium]
MEHATATATAPYDRAADRGVPSLVWRFGQDRRLDMIRQWAGLEGAVVLVDGCGIGAYVQKMQAVAAQVIGLDIEWERIHEGVQQARQAPKHGLLHVGACEALPYRDRTFDVVLSHEVLEHVQDDRLAAAEMIRVLKPGGRAVIFAPNRLYPFETHGHYWRGRYHFGNTPLINYLPDPLRNRLAPHVRAYTATGLRRLFDGLPVRTVHHSQIFPGYDKLSARRPRLGRVLRTVTYALERSPLRYFGLSHLLVIERC